MDWRSGTMLKTEKPLVASLKRAVYSPQWSTKFDDACETWWFCSHLILRFPILGPADVSKVFFNSWERSWVFSRATLHVHSSWCRCLSRFAAFLGHPFWHHFWSTCIFLNEDITFTGVSWLFTILSWHPLYPSLANNKQGRPVYSPLKVKMENLGFPTSELNTYLDSNEAGRGLGFLKNSHHHFTRHLHSYIH